MFHEYMEKNFTLTDDKYMQMKTTVKYYLSCITVWLVDRVIIARAVKGVVRSCVASGSDSA